MFRCTTVENNLEEFLFFLLAGKIFHNFRKEILGQMTKLKQGIFCSGALVPFQESPSLIATINFK